MYNKLKKKTRKKWILYNSNKNKSLCKSKLSYISIQFPFSLSIYIIYILLIEERENIRDHKKRSSCPVRLRRRRRKRTRASIPTGKVVITRLESAIRSPPVDTLLRGSSVGESFPLFGSLTIPKPRYVLIYFCEFVKKVLFLCIELISEVKI